MVVGRLSVPESSQRACARVPLGGGCCGASFCDCRAGRSHRAQKSVVVLSCPLLADHAGVDCAKKRENKKTEDGPRGR